MKKHKHSDIYTRNLMLYLAEVREDCEVSTKDMAEYIGITENHLKALEKGENINIPVTIVLDYMDRLDLDYSSIFEEVENRITGRILKALKEEV